LKNKTNHQNKNIRLIFTALAVGFLFTGCMHNSVDFQPDVPPAAQPTNTPTIFPTTIVPPTGEPTLPPPQISVGNTRTATPGATPFETPTNQPPVEHQPDASYRIAAVFDYAAKHLRVNEHIEISHYPKDQEQLVLLNEAGLRDQVFNLTSLTVNDQPPADILQENGTITFKLFQFLIDPIRVKIEYELALPPGPAKLGYTNNQVNFGDWYLAVPPYQTGEGWIVHPPSLVGEHMLLLPAAFQVRLEIINSPTPLILAASGAYESTSPNHYEFSINKARSFAWSVSAEYATATRQVGTMTLIAYYLPGYQSAAQAVLEATANAVSLYTNQIGSLDLSTLSMVQGEFLDGMEYSGLYFLGQEYYQEYNGSPASYLVPIAVHETAHQWFYSVVGNDQAMEPWLDESICTYLELLYFENYLPDLVPWWWQFRVMRFNPVGWVNSTIYQHSTFRSYVDAVYLRGALWMDHFRTVIGDKLFFYGLQNYFQQYQNQITTREDFFGVYQDLGISHIDELVEDYFSLP
jgi:hypothetical protein